MAQSYGRIARRPVGEAAEQVESPFGLELWWGRSLLDCCGFWCGARVGVISQAISPLIADNHWGAREHGCAGLSSTRLVSEGVGVELESVVINL